MKAKKPIEVREDALRPYAKSILESLPQVLPRIGVDQWRRTLEVVYDKDEVLTIGTREIRMNPFIRKLMDVLKEGSEEKINYTLDELSNLQNRTNQILRKGPVDLETFVLDSVKSNFDRFSVEDLSSLHNLFLDMYHEKESFFPEATKYFNDFITSMGEVPQSLTSEAINEARKIIRKKSLMNSRKTAHEDDGEEPAFNRRESGTFAQKKNRLAVAYAQAVAKNIGSIGQGLSTWVDTAIKRCSSIDDLIEYFEDKHGYFGSDVETVAGGLPLSQINGRLLAYVQALIGRPIKLEKSPSNSLACSFREGTLFLPQIVNAGKDNYDNFSIYKALASYQAGAIIFETYLFDTSRVSAKRRKKLSEESASEEFFASFSNPDFARALFGLVEFSRIDYRLNNKFPGLRKDLDVFRETSLHNQENAESEAERMLNSVQGYIFQDPKTELVKPIIAQLDNVRKVSSTVAESLEATEKIYEFFERQTDLSLPLRFTPEPIIDLEIILEEKERVATHLIAEANQEVATGRKFRYDEWDKDAQKYKEGYVQVVETPYPLNGNNSYVRDLIAKDHAAIQRLRQNFESLAPEELEIVRRQLSGDIDYEEAVKARAEMAAGITPSEKIYTREYKNRRSVSSIVLAENSGSLRKFLDLKNPDLRIVDIIKQAQVYFSEALDAIGDRYALATFSGETEKNVEFYLLKDFDHPYDESVKKTIGSLRPMKQNRDGAGIRHAAFLLNRQPENTRLLFYLMEGTPHDFSYEGAYAIEDTKKAIIEAKKGGCIPVVLAFGADLKGEVRSLAEHAIYREVRDPRAVPQLLPQIYRRMAV